MTINLPAVLVANGAGVLMLLILIFSSKKTIRNRLPDNAMFYMMVGTAMLQCVLESLSFIIDGSPAPNMRFPVLLNNSVLFINNIVFAFVWVIYCDYKLFGDMKRILRIYPFIAIPGILVIVGSVLNLFFPVFFRVSEVNVYIRDGLFWIPYIVSYLYLGYGVLMIYLNKNKGKKYLFMPAILFMIPIIISSILQYFIYGLSLLWLGTAISLVSIYINVQNEVSFIDLLSGLYNRQYMNRFLDLEIRKSSQDKQLVGIMLDIDKFKSINDRFGHLTGDDAIKTAGAIIKACVPPQAIAVRYAGDEFVIVGTFDSTDDVDVLVRSIKDSTDSFCRAGKRPYTLCFSVGRSVYNRKSDTIDSFIDRMDSAMYDEKNKKKQGEC